MKPIKPEILYDKVANWVLTEGPRVVMALVIFVVGMWLIRVFKKWLRKRLAKKELDSSFQPFLVSLTITALQVFLVLSIIQIMGFRMTILTTLVGAIGVAAGLALSGTMQNFTSGILILVLKPYRMGDYIIAQGQEGVVSSIQLFYTVVITVDNRTVIIPNSKLSNEVIINISKQGKRRLDLEMKFNYGFSFDQIKGIIEKTLHDSPLVENEPNPRIGISALDPDGFKVIVNGWVDAFEFEASKYRVLQKIVDALKGSGIKLPGMA